jgi:hypothetical protein
MKTKTFGHPKARKFIVKNMIPYQGIQFFGNTLEEAALATLMAEIVENKGGSTGKALRAEAKALAEKFAKANPDFKFSRFGRTVGSKNQPKEVAPETKASKAKSPKTKAPKVAESKPKMKSKKRELVEA